MVDGQKVVVRTTKHQNRLFKPRLERMTEVPNCLTNNPGNKWMSNLFQVKTHYKYVQVLRYKCNA